MATQQDYLSLYFIKTLNKGSGVLNLSKTREDLIKKYVKYVSDEIKCERYYLKNKDEYIFSFKIPSESNYKYVRPFFYDVILSFTPINKDMQKEGSRTLNDYKIKIFSNMPSFVFSYQYIFRQRKFLIDWIPKSKLNSYALTKPPSIKNSYGIINYEKSLYFSYLYILYNKFYDKEYFLSNCIKTISYSSILKNIRSQDDLMKDYNKHKKLYSNRTQDESKRKLNFLDSKFNNKESKQLFSFLNING